MICLLGVKPLTLGRLSPKLTMSFKHMFYLFTTGFHTLEEQLASLHDSFIRSAVSHKNTWYFRVN